MKYPPFFDTIENIIVYDDLCKFLGVNTVFENADAVIEVTY